MHDERLETHSTVLSYVLWVFGFTGAHRFYLGRPLTGLLWLLTGGLLLIGWIWDLFYIPAMRSDAGRRYQSGPIDYTVTWLLFGLLGILGIHRFYMGKWGTGILYAFSGGLLGLGLIYDLFTLNIQISELNYSERQ